MTGVSVTGVSVTGVSVTVVSVPVLALPVLALPVLALPVVSVPVLALPVLERRFRARVSPGEAIHQGYEPLRGVRGDAVKLGREVGERGERDDGRVRVVGRRRGRRRLRRARQRPPPRANRRWYL